ncbi:MAG: cell division protein ZipA [Bermanella sp.]|jgi:cell division protein ZipA
MDISLHSFILVVGVIVIAFIVLDGVKKVRAARANQLNQSLDSYEELDALSNDDAMPVFDDLEIKDDFLKHGLSQESDASIEFDHAPSAVEAAPLVTEQVQGTISDFDSQAPVESEGSCSDKAEPIFNVLAEDVPVQDEQITVAVDDEFEHFAAHRHDIAQEPGEQLVAKRPEVKVPTNTSSQTQDHRASALLAKQNAIDTSVPEKSTPKRISKEALAAQLAKVKEEANAHIAQPSAPVEDEITVDDKEPVPVLMEPVELGQKVDPNPPKQHELVLPEFIQQTLQDEPIYAIEEEPVATSMKPDPLMEYIEDVQTLPVGEKLSEREAAQEIFVINILKQDGKGLLGRELHHVFNVCDMRHGEMGIFHRFEKANAQGKIQFSVVNAIEPGTFDLASIDELITPGISLFMSLPGPDKPMEAFDAMAEVALVFARNFNATLHDDTHSDLTPQTLEHYRNRVREFSRKHLSHKK